jgi:ATP-dependent Clp protease ATP-binding subunit ClpX
VDELIRESIKTGRDPGPLTFYIAKRLEYGLKLIRDRSGIEEFTIGSGAITDMEDYINSLLKKHYRRDLDSGMKDIYQDMKALKE